MTIKAVLNKGKGCQTRRSFHLRLYTMVT